MICKSCQTGYPHSAFCKANSACPDGKCGLVLKEEPPGLTPTPPMEPEPDIKETSGTATGSLGGEKATSTGNIGKDGGASPIPEGVDIEQPKPTPQAALPTGVLDMGAEATKEELSERVGEIADVVGEKEAVELVEDVVEASEKLDNVGVGIGSGGSGDASTMADFGKPYSRDTAVVKSDPEIKQASREYEEYIRKGGSPEDIYFLMLEQGFGGQPAPDWFGTRDERFRLFLIEIYRRGLPIPTIRLRIQGNKEGEIVADPSMMAFDLLQTAVNRMRGMIDKDVSPVEHEHTEDGPVPLPRPGLIDTRGIPQKECNGFMEWTENIPERTLVEPEESETYYLNLALKSLNKHKDKQGSTAHHKVLPIKRQEKYRQGSAFARPVKEEEYHWEPGVNPIAPKPSPRRDMSKPPAPLKSLNKDGQGGVEKHKDKQGSTAHHQRGGVAAPPAVSGPQEEMEMEDRVQTLTAEIKERNAKGANLRLSPGYRNAPYAVTGMDALQRPLRLVGNVADITQALRENSAEVDEIMEQRKMDNYAVPVDIGKVNELKIYEGDGVSPMDIVREQVARASFTSAVATVMKQPKRGWRARDYRMDDAQQVEPENVSVMGGVRFPGNQNMQGHATTEIEQGGDVEGISGTKINIPTEPLDTPPAAGIAQQGAISPPQGIQGTGERPEFVQVHADQPMHGVREENEGTGIDPRADADNRGAPVAHKTQRP